MEKLELKPVWKRCTRKDNSWASNYM